MRKFDDPQFGQRGEEEKKKIFRKNDKILAQGEKVKRKTPAKTGKVEIYDEQTTLADEKIKQKEIGEEAYLPPAETIPAKISDQEQKTFLPDDKTAEKEDLTTERQVLTNIETEEKRKFKEEQEKLQAERGERNKEKAVEDLANDLLARIGPDYFERKLFGGDVKDQLLDLRKKIEAIKAHKVDESESGAFESLEQKKEKLEEAKAEVGNFLNKLVEGTRNKYIQREKEVQDSWRGLRKFFGENIIKDDIENNMDVKWLRGRYKNMADNYAIFQSMESSDKYDLETDINKKRIRTADEIGEKMDKDIESEKVDLYVREREADLKTPYSGYSDGEEKPKPKGIKNRLKAKFKGMQDKNQERIISAYAQNRVPNTERETGVRGIKFGEDIRKELKKTDAMLADYDKAIEGTRKLMETAKTREGYYYKDPKEMQRLMIVTKFQKGKHDYKAEELELENKKRDLELRRSIIYIAAIRDHVSGGKTSRWNEIKDQSAENLIFDKQGQLRADSRLSDVYRTLDQKLFPLSVNEETAIAEEKPRVKESKELLNWKEPEKDAQGKNIYPFKYVFISEDLKPKENETASAWITRMVKLSGYLGEEDLFSKEKPRRDNTKSHEQLTGEYNKQKEKQNQENQIDDIIDDSDDEGQKNILDALESNGSKPEKIKKIIIEQKLKKDGIWEEYKKMLEGKPVKDDKGKEKNKKPTAEEIEKFLREKGIVAREFASAHLEEFSRKMKKLKNMGLSGLAREKKLNLIINNVPDYVLDSINENIFQKLAEDDRGMLIEKINQNRNLSEINDFILENLPEEAKSKLEGSEGKETLLKQNFLVFMLLTEKRERPKSINRGDSKSSSDTTKKPEEEPENDNSKPPSRVEEYDSSADD